MGKTKEYLHEKLVLDNGLTVEFWDKSRKDEWGLWTVCLMVKSGIPIKEEYFRGFRDGSDQYHRVRQLFGGEITYTYEKTRKHVSERSKDAVFDIITCRFKDAMIKYLSREDFPRKFVLRELWKRFEPAHFLT